MADTQLTFPAPKEKPSPPAQEKSQADVFAGGCLETERSHYRLSIPCRFWGWQTLG